MPVAVVRNLGIYIDADVSINVQNHSLYAIVKGGITHRQQQISVKGDITQHGIA